MSITTVISLLLILASLIGIAGVFALSNLQIYDWVTISIILIIGILIVGLYIIHLNKAKNDRKITIADFCELLFAIGILNFFFLFIVDILIGGSAFNGKIDGERYFVSEHGVYTEVSFIIYVFSMVQTVSIFFTHPLAMIAGAAYAISGGWNRARRPRTIVDYLEDKPSTPINSFINGLERIYWKGIDLIEGIFYILLDSWRKPDLEIITSYNKQECMSTIHEATIRNGVVNNPDATIIDYFSGNHFYLLRREYNFFLRNRPFLVVAGKLSSNTNGATVKLWHRLATGTLFFINTMFGIVLFLILLVFGVGWLRQSYSPEIVNNLIAILFIIILPIVNILFFLLLLLLGSFIGEARNAKLIQMVRNIIPANGTEE
jgi:hypothetical protein